MNHATITAPTPTDLKFDARSMTWLLTHSHAAADFFLHGLARLSPIDDQTFIGRIVAKGDFQSGGETMSAVAILKPSWDGVHRLLNVGLSREGDPWPTLCSELEQGLFGSDAAAVE